MRHFIIILSIAGLVLPNFGLAQEQMPQLPQTLEEAKSVGIKILKDLPDQIKKVWQEEAWPLLKKTWQKLWSLAEPYWQKFLSFLGKEVEKRKPAFEEEFQKEKEEMQKEMKEVAPKVGKSLWERFKALLK